MKEAIAGAASVWMMDRVSWYMYRNEGREDYQQEKKVQIGGNMADGQVYPCSGTVMRIRIPE